MPGKTRQQLQEEFDEGIRRLWIFYNREGYCMVNREYKEDDGYFLGRFIKNSLNKYQNGYLPEENIAKLEEFPGWHWSPKSTGQKKKINTLVNALVAFHREHGHLRVPPELTIDGQNIKKLITYFKGRYSTNRSSKKEITALESIPGWKWGKPDSSFLLEKRWESKFQQLIKYAMQYGHTFVPQLYEVNGKNFGRWVELQRSLYAEGKLLDHRVKRLETLSLWKWKKDSYDDFFEDGIKCLTLYYENNSFKMPPPKIKTSYGTSLNEWILTQRKQYRLGKMPKKRIRKLEAIPGWGWTSKEQLWMDYFYKLKNFSDRFDHCDVPSTYRIKGANLRNWTMKARREFVKDELSDIQKKLLQSLKGWQSFVEQSVLYIKTLDQSPAKVAIYKILDENPDQSLSMIAQKSGYTISTCSKYRRKYFQM